MALSASRPKPGGAARCRAARPRPKASSARGPPPPRSIHSSARNRGPGASPTATTAGVRSAPAVASQASPSASERNDPGGAWGWCLRKTRRPLASVTRSARLMLPPPTGSAATTASPVAEASADSTSGAALTPGERAVAQVREQSQRRGVDHGEDDGEALGTAVVGVGHRQVPARHGGGIELAQQPHLGVGGGVGRQGAQVGRVLVVHRQDEVEAVEVGRVELAGAPAHRDPPRPGLGPGPGVGRPSPRATTPCPRSRRGSPPRGPPPPRGGASRPRPWASGRCCPGRRTRAGPARDYSGSVGATTVAASSRARSSPRRRASRSLARRRESIR